MILEKGAMRANATEIKGVTYVTFSFFEGTELVFDYIGKLIENSFAMMEPADMKNENLS